MFNERYFQNLFPKPTAQFLWRKSWYGHLLTYITEQFNIEFHGHEKRALDIGCGYGYVVDILRENGYEAYGIDVSKYAIKVANKMLRSRANCLVCDVQSGIPFRIKFDLITCFSILEHLKRPILTLAHLKEALKKNGILLVVTPCKSICSSLWYKLVYKGGDATHISVKRLHEWEEILRNCGFTEIHVKPFTHIPLVFKLRGKLLVVNLRYFSDNVVILARV